LTLTSTLFYTTNVNSDSSAVLFLFHLFLPDFDFDLICFYVVMMTIVSTNYLTSTYRGLAFYEHRPRWDTELQPGTTVQGRC